MANSDLPFPVLPEGTVTFLFTDIEASTDLLERLRSQYAPLLEKHREILSCVFEKWKGQVIDSRGEEFFIAFPRASDAVSAAIEAQKELGSSSWPAGAEVKVRMGLHTGEPWVAEAGYVGIDVHRAARIGSVGHGGQVLLSETTTSLVRDELPDRVDLRDLGPHKLKGVSRPESICQLIIGGLISDFPPLKSQEDLPRAIRRWRTNRSAILRQSIKAGIGGAVALALFGATRPLQIYLISPNEYQERLEVLVLPAWILVSAFATSFFGAFQGLASGYMAGLGDTLVAGRTYAPARLLFSSMAGLAHTAYLVLFSALELFRSPEVGPSVYIPLYVLYGLFLGATLSFVIPLLGTERSASKQLMSSMWVTIVLWSVTIPLIIATYGPDAPIVLMFRLGFVASLPFGMGLALRKRETNRALTSA